MSFTIKILKESAIATFSNSVEENEIKNAFIKVTESVSIEKLNYIIFDYSNITSYTIPKDYINTLKMVTHFSTNWNRNIKAVTVATNKNIRTAVTEIMKHNKDLKWEYHLFEDLDVALKWCIEN